MKRLTYLSLLALLTVAACSKKKQDTQVTPWPHPPTINYNVYTTPIPDDGGCINQIWVDNTSSNLTADDVAKVKQLFQQNNLSYDNLELNNVSYFTTANLPDVNLYAHEYVNGILCFNVNQYYAFKNGKIDVANSSNYKISSSLDTIATLRLAQVRKRFVDCLLLNGAYFSTLKDSCMVARFGYYNINIENNSNSQTLVKAWKVSMKNFSLPYAYIKDDGTVEEFFSGLVY